MVAVIDLTGHRYGRLTVLERAGSIRNKARWRCVCACGKTVLCDSNSLREKHTTSCGCRSRESARERLRSAMTRHGENAGGVRTHEYKTWCRMIARCEDKERKHYGAKGIAVHPAWRSDFLCFLAYIGRAPSKHHTIDRIENAKGYEPGNVRWATQKEQGRNKTNNHLLTVGGETAPLVVWAERTGLTLDALSHRLRLGWSPLRAVTTPRRSYVRRK